MEFIAHVRESDGKIQTVREHLLEVKHLAEGYGEKIGVKHIAGLAGLLHDLGKYTCEFRDYLLNAIENPDAPSKRGSVDHSTAGGKLLYEMYHSNKAKEKMWYLILSEVVGNSILSHHSYLLDFLTPQLESNYLYRVKEKPFPEFSETKRLFFEHVMSESEFKEYVERAAKELEIFNRKRPLEREKNLMFLIKFIFSTLIDGDRTNTRLFEENVSYELEVDTEELFQKFYHRLMKKIDSFKSEQGEPSPIDKLRSEMSEQCAKFAERPSGIYTLSIPTGGGKTLASLRFGLRHALLQKKKRIIYIVPFTTIIEQNAQEVREILQDDANILEHHSNIINDSIDDEAEDGRISNKQKLKLAKDNWDSPIIFTTMVQFLNVFYAKGSRNSRRMHNLSESVVIFDEVQKVPTSCVSLFNDALNFLKDYAHSTMVLCTATQPALNFVEQKLEITHDGEMIAQVDKVIDAFKRVEMIDLASESTFTNEKLVSFIEEQMKEKESILVILNTKSVVRDLYEKLKEIGGDVSLYHLSTSMCAAHRNKKLAEMRKKLKNREKVLCVSTQLIEAGVDISFQSVVRSLAGLDSVAQAAGRCNRHGEMDGLQSVYMIDHEEENLDKLSEIQAGKMVTKQILKDLKRDSTVHGGHLLSRQAIERFFQVYYTELKVSLNYPIPSLGTDMVDLLYASRKKNKYLAEARSYNQKFDLYLANSYRTAAENFQVIESLTTSVLVPYGEGKEIIAELNSSRSIKEYAHLLRKAQYYSINLFEHEKRELIQNGGLISYLDGEIFVLVENTYDDEYGLNTKSEAQMGGMFF
ncbi:CRISPR-associated protein Cas3 [Alkalihalobacillus alcalophilus ATCC 27647 = CGMCC 1.3604]|uniref:CRISPR-associated protein Cas3 n=1 Tax=Alkalihalobacillus alcalophilus ATCC 27647 = CGMCC 1.3604 TaxID=1218173 RepID=A0A094XJP0_ALKAL|nr:CRISPR-associated helicase/endonuclease Cas3 [Alkalihalobacillus alcalophilus]KGA98995.1 CRISPR-associated protein Cas3 [Alkalihalobacillus alcalophilus ATCC 27647 = CGMCC 1.3604]MED1560629.1 CRISPR-associated helicase/endonuclease Cas3 [Alkalihalobacillus alcalophilus]THG88743.1 CRISPR-associated protein Cas3 [Alkalihalobacillus alcalophilus ATCC 27647 = CGMCC 1.3604]